MMNHLNDIGIDKLIQSSYAALKSGDREKARVYAQKAADLSPDSEQAWLILASMSKSDQALYYLENALRANPESEAAKKGIRVIFEEMAAQEKKPEVLPDEVPEGPDLEEPPIKIGDTSPIPVQSERVSTTEETAEKATQKEVEDQSRDKIQVTSIIPKLQLRKKLRKKKEPKPEITPSYGQSAEEKKEILRKKLSKPAVSEDQPMIEDKPTRQIRFRKKPAKKIDEAVLPLEIPVVEKEPFEDFPQPIPKKTRGKTSADSVNLTIPSEEVPASTLADNLTHAFAKNEREIDLPIDRQPAHDLVAKDELEPQEKVPETKNIAETKTKIEVEVKKESPQKKTVKKPEKKKEPKAKRTTEKKKVLTSGDVDIIEVVLISLAAIMLPVLAFLYFFLNK